MYFKRFASACIGAALGVAACGSAASAADLSVYKAPPPPPPAGSDIHGFFDVTFSNVYITPRGLLVTNTGLTTQILSGMAFDLYKDKNGWINSVTAYAGFWNDLWSQQDHPLVGSWNEFDWFAGVKIGFAKYFKAGIEYVVFLSPPGNFRQERNLELSLAFDDGSLTGWPISINPYVKLFYAISGDSTVVVGKQGDTYDVEIGIAPTLALKKYTGIPLLIAAPTWITVGPTTYWNAGGNICGGVLCATNNAGVFSTGLTGKLSLDAIPSRLGNWYVKAGVQYYNILNDSLLLAQTVVGTAPTFAAAHKEIWAWTAGLGFSF
jgi:hypothetical protein